MDIGSLLALVAILLGIYRIARPLQRRSIRLVCSTRRVWIAVIVAVVILLFYEAAPVILEWHWLPWEELAFRWAYFAIPAAALVWTYFEWNRAHLPAGRGQDFAELLRASVRENAYDEAERIIRANSPRLAILLSEEDAQRVFDPRLVRALMDSDSWIHLELLADRAFREKLASPDRAIETVTRAILERKESPLRSMVVEAYGGDEHLVYTESERRMMDQTYRDPTWYHDTNAFYALHIALWESVRSGALDESYNSPSYLYNFDQGVSARSYCPVYLAIKTQVIAIMAAIEKGFEGDIYVTNLWEAFSAIIQHSRYTDTSGSDPEQPPPYAYLLNEINNDLCRLSTEGVRRGVMVPDIAPIHNGTSPSADRNVGSISRQLAHAWAVCVSVALNSEGHVSEEFRVDVARDYLVFLLKMKAGATHELWVDIGGNARFCFDPWIELYLTELRSRCYDVWDELTLQRNFGASREGS